ncbi:hypothetical protein HD806DRAFT_535567 [Xylariaceae sp. AK1471]|nr:hypothetical protein HD806DRAFT_535567 [Xylariaceae sp. AK1471]
MSSQASTSEEEATGPSKTLRFAIQPPKFATRGGPLPTPIVISGDLSVYQGIELELILSNLDGRWVNIGRNMVNVLQPPEFIDGSEGVQDSTGYAVFPVHVIDAIGQCYFGVRKYASASTQDAINYENVQSWSRPIELEKDKRSKETPLSSEEARLAMTLKNNTANFKYMLPDVVAFGGTSPHQYLFARIPSLKFVVEASENTPLGRVYHPPPVIQVQNRQMFGGEYRDFLRDRLAKKIPDPYIVMALVRGSVRKHHEPDGHFSIHRGGNHEGDQVVGDHPRRLLLRNRNDNCVEPDRYVVFNNIIFQGGLPDPKNTGTYHIRAFLYAKKDDPYPLTWVDSEYFRFSISRLHLTMVGQAKEEQWLLETLSRDEGFQFALPRGTPPVQWDKYIEGLKIKYHISSSALPVNSSTSRGERSKRSKGSHHRGGRR